MQREQFLIRALSPIVYNLGGYLFIAGLTMVLSMEFFINFFGSCLNEDLIVRLDYVNNQMVRIAPPSLHGSLLAISEGQRRMMTIMTLGGRNIQGRGIRCIGDRLLRRFRRTNYQGSAANRDRRMKRS
jgi:hypothetical protein